MAATVIDTLVTEVGLDVEKFKRGQKEHHEAVKKVEADTEHMSKLAEAQAKVIEKAFDKIKEQTLELLTVFTGGKELGDFIKETMEMNVQLGRTSQLLNLTPTSLRAFQNATITMGGTADEANKSIMGLAQSFEDFYLTGKGNMEMQNALNILGVSIGNMQTGKLNDTSESIYKIADGLHKIYATNPLLANSLADKLGMGETFRQEMFLGGEAMRKMHDRLADIDPISEEDIRLSNELMQTWGTLKIRAESLTEQMGGPLVDVLNDVLNGLKQWSTSKDAIAFTQELKEALEGLGHALKGVDWGTIIVGAVTGLEYAVKLVNAFVTGLKRASEVLTFIVRFDADFLHDTVGDGKITDLWKDLKANFKDNLSDNYKDPSDGDLGAPDKDGKSLVGRVLDPAVSTKFKGIEDAAGIKPGTLAAIAQVESGGQTYYQSGPKKGQLVTSPTGAKGEFQFVGGTARQYHADVTDEMSSAGAAGHLMSDLLRHYGGDYDKALAAYNQGQTKVDRAVAAGGEHWLNALAADGGIEGVKYVRSVDRAMANQQLTGNAGGGAALPGAAQGDKHLTVNVEVHAPNAKNAADITKEAFSAATYAQANAGALKVASDANSSVTQ